MSSKLTAPKLCCTILTNSMIFSGWCLPLSSRLSIQRGTASTPPRYFISIALPSITPKPPGGVQSPSPNTRVLSLTTATIWALLLNRKEVSLSSRMVVETADTPGVYHTLNQLKPYTGAFGKVCILPP